jgi:hypothetical protein
MRGTPEMHAYEMHAYEMHACGTYARERGSRERHVHSIHIPELYALSDTQGLLEYRLPLSLGIFTATGNQSVAHLLV